MDVSCIGKLVCLYALVRTYPRPSATTRQQGLVAGLGNLEFVNLGFVQKTAGAETPDGPLAANPRKSDALAHDRERPRFAKYASGEEDERPMPAVCA